MNILTIIESKDLKSRPKYFSVLLQLKITRNTENNY